MVVVGAYKYVAYAGSDLTELIASDCGQNGIAS